MKELREEHKNLLGSYKDSEYKKYIDGYSNELFNLLFGKLEIDKIKNGNTEFNEKFKSDILVCIDLIKKISKDEKICNYLKKNHEKENYSVKDVLGRIKQLSKYLDKYYK